ETWLSSLQVREAGFRVLVRWRRQANVPPMVKDLELRRSDRSPASMMSVLGICRSGTERTYLPSRIGSSDGYDPSSLVPGCGIATVFDFDSEGDHDFLVMEFVPGGTLESRLQEGPLPLAAGSGASVPQPPTSSSTRTNWHYQCAWDLIEA